MLSEKELTKFHAILSNRREEIFLSRLQLDESWQTLQETEVEAEEPAKKEKMAQALVQLDEQEKEQVEAIDAALRKLAAGSYGSAKLVGRIFLWIDWKHFSGPGCVPQVRKPESGSTRRPWPEE